jgi:CRISPR system Cascade subunit CasA
MKASFDLTEQPWIPCRFPDGRIEELSTHEALARAHEIKAIVDESPLVVAVLHRHLLAVLHRCYSGPRTMSEWAGIACAARFDIRRIENYLSQVRTRMDLLHATHPFAQTRGLLEQFEPDPIDQLSLERSKWGTARELFQHRPTTHSPRMGLGEATRLLLVHHAFATGGLVKKKGEPVSATASPLVRSALVLLCGPNLFQTLVSNLLVYDQEQRPIPLTGEDAPSWEQPPQPSRLPLDSEPKRLPLGWLDLLTWQSRRLELRVNDSMATGFVRAVGKGLAEGCPRDPMVAYRRDEERGFVPIGLSLTRSFWRSANALFEATRGDQSHFDRPRTIDQAASRQGRTALGEASVYGIEVFGLSAEKSLVNFSRSERVAAPLPLFDDPNARDSVTDVLRLCDEAIRALRSALWSYGRYALSPGTRSPQTKDVSDLVDSLGAEAAAWSALGVEFETFLRVLAVDRLQARSQLEHRLHRIIERRFLDAVSRSDSAGRGLQARAIAERQLRIALHALESAPPNGQTTVQETIHA